MINLANIILYILLCLCYGYGYKVYYINLWFCFQLGYRSFTFEVDCLMGCVFVGFTNTHSNQTKTSSTLVCLTSSCCIIVSLSSFYWLFSDLYLCQLRSFLTSLIYDNNICSLFLTGALRVLHCTFSNHLSCVSLISLVSD